MHAISVHVHALLLHTHVLQLTFMVAPFRQVVPVPTIGGVISSGHNMSVQAQTPLLQLHVLHFSFLVVPCTHRSVLVGG